MNKNDNLITLDLAKLSVGDSVAINVNKTIGYYYFCEGYSFKTIKRITPKRTKIIFTDGTETTTRREVFFEVNNYIIETERKAKKRVLLVNLLLKYAQFSSIRRAVLKLTERELDRYIDIFKASEKAYEEIKGKEV